MVTETMTNRAEPANSRGTEQTRNGATFPPNVDIFEMPQELQLTADIPGARGESISVNYEKGTLTIHAKIEPRTPRMATFIASTALVITGGPLR